jgi:amino-acid N-acetyltransferase
MSSLTIRRAVIQDALAIHELIQGYVEEEIVLPVPMYRLFERIREFIVAEEDGRIVGCGSLVILWHDLAEIRTLVVRKGHQRGGVGRQIVEDLVEEARSLGIARIFALTFQTGFFIRMGFQEASKETLPLKVWKDCRQCPRIEHCDEVAVDRILIPESERRTFPTLPEMPFDPSLIMPVPAE